MSIPKVFRHIVRKSKSAAPPNEPTPDQRAAFQREYDYWSGVLSNKLSQLYGLQLTERQLDASLVPSLKEIKTIQSESKANRLVFLSSGMQACVYYLEELERAGVDPTRFERILEFGVGFARILRHFDPFKAELFGCDATANVIHWCQQHLPSMAEFLHSDFDPPLPYPDGHFDFIFANSVFTHLQHEQTLSWIAELRRIVRDDGMVITTHYDINEHLRCHAASKLHQAWNADGRLQWGNSSVRENNICYSPERLRIVWSDHFEVLEHRQYPLEQSHLVCRAA